MATVVNDRDVLLRSASTRVTSADAAVIVTPNASGFHTHVDGTHDPATITVTANLIKADGPITFTAQGATLSNITATTADISFADMSGVSAVITASAANSGTAVSGSCIIGKVADGTPGAPGTNGPRGPGHFYATGSSWVDATADAACPGGKIVSDVVTISNGTNFVMEKKWDGSAWNPTAVVIDGSLIVPGSVTASQINANGLTIRDTNGNIILNAGTGQLATSAAAPGTLNSDIVPSIPVVLSLVGRNCTVTGNSLIKTAGVNPNWDADCYSKDGFVGGAFVSFVVTQINANVMVGLNTDPTTDRSYGSIDRAIYLRPEPLFDVYENGASATNDVCYSQYAVGDTFAVVADGSTVKYLHNGVVFRSAAWTPTDPLYLDSSIYQLGAGVSNVRFGPLSSNAWASIGGAGKPEDNANFTSASRGAALNDDPCIENANAWSRDATVLIGTDSIPNTGATGAVCPNYLYSDGPTNQFAHGVRKFAIDPAKTYLASAMLYAAAGSDRDMYLYLNFYDKSNTQLNPGWGGNMSAYPFGGTTPTGVFTRQGAYFGANTGRSIPSGTVTAEVGVWFNYSGSGTTTVRQAAQDIRIEEATLAYSNLLSINNISSDNMLSKGEKSRVVQDWNTIAGEKAGIDSQADALSVSRSSYDTAYTALQTYLQSLSPDWANPAYDTPIDGPTFRGKFSDYYTAKQSLQDAMHAKAATTASALTLNADGTLSGPGGAQGQATLPGMGHHTFRVVATGLSETVIPTSTTGLYKDGTSIYGYARSYMLVIIRRSDGAVIINKQYDVYGAAAGSDAAALATDLNSYGPSYIAVVYTFDEPYNNRLTGGLDTAMYRCGASRNVFGSPNFQGRAAYILVGICGCGEGNGVEAYQGAVNSDTNAWCDLSFTLLGGNIVGVSSTFKPKTLMDYGFTGAMNANYVDNTNQLTDGAGLGTKANWSLVSNDDGNRPANGATVGAPAGTNVGSTPATTVESNAANGQSAYNAVNDASAGLSTKLANNARSVLSGGAGLAVGSLVWDGSGNRTSGFGIGLNSYGLVGYNSSGALTFAINASTGAATFNGDITGSNGTFYGALSGVTGSFAGSLSAVTGNFNTLTIASGGWLRSSNYVASSSGFTFNSDGTAELGVLSLRGAPTGPASGTFNPCTTTETTLVTLASATGLVEAHKVVLSFQGEAHSPNNEAGATVLTLYQGASAGNETTQVARWNPSATYDYPSNSWTQTSTGSISNTYEFSIAADANRTGAGIYFKVTAFVSVAGSTGTYATSTISTNVKSTTTT